MMFNMSSAMRGGGSPFDSFAGGGPGAFPAPGVPGGGATNAANPTTGSPNPSTAGTGTSPASPPPNPFFNPALMQQMMSAMGGGAAGANPWGLGGLGATPPPPTDSRPPEERFQTQLQVGRI